MKVRLILTVDVDPEEWTAEHGTTGAAAIRTDVRDYVRHAVRDHLVSQGIAHEVYLAPTHRPARIRQ